MRWGRPLENGAGEGGNLLTALICPLHLTTELYTFCLLILLCVLWVRTAAWLSKEKNCYKWGWRTSNENLKRWLEVGRTFSIRLNLSLGILPVVKVKWGKEVVAHSSQLWFTKMPKLFLSHTILGMPAKQCCSCWANSLNSLVNNLENPSWDPKER